MVAPAPGTAPRTPPTPWERVARRIADLPIDVFLARVRAAPADQRNDLLRARFRYDVGMFLKYCFPAVFELPWNPYHLDQLTNRPPSWSERRGCGEVIREAVAAPRGVAKTTLLKGELVHDVCYGLERFTVVLSAEERLALSINSDVRTFLLDTSSPLADLFGPFALKGAVEEFVATPAQGPAAGIPAAFLARSWGTQVRGANYKTQRPTKIVVDDGERSDRVRNPEQRRIWQDFLVKDVLKCGPRDGGCLVRWRGTVLHTDAILARLLENPGWISRKWQAIISWPVNVDLWDKCHEVWSDLSDPDRQSSARAFYAAHRDQMDEGVEVLDAHAQGIYRCFEQIWSEGLASFLQECQNDPKDPSASLFSSERFARCRVEGRTVVAADGRRIPFDELAFAARLDPALGASAGMPGEASGDFACIAVVARDKFGYMYVVDVWLRRAKPAEQINAIWSLFDRWGFDQLTIESNGFAALIGRDFRQAQAERRSTGRPWKINVIDVNSVLPKDERIAALEPPIQNGWLQFSVGTSPEVLSQFDAFPTGNHDDAPDAVAGACQMFPPQLPQVHEQRRLV